MRNHPSHARMDMRAPPFGIFIITIPNLFLYRLAPSFR